MISTGHESKNVTANRLLNTWIQQENNMNGISQYESDTKTKKIEICILEVTLMRQLYKL